MAYYKLKQNVSCGGHLGSQGQSQGQQVDKPGTTWKVLTYRTHILNINTLAGYNKNLYRQQTKGE